MSKAVMQQAFDLLCDAVEPTATQIQADIGMCAQWDVDAIECIDTLRQALAQPEQDAGKCGCGANLYIDENGKPCSKAQTELVVNEKDGSPCPEFWDWLPKAYNFEGNGTFTKYNMEVAFLAGKNTALAQPEQEPFKPDWVSYRQGMADGAAQTEQELVTNSDLYSIAGRLALELECFLLDTKDISIASKWWDSAHEALDQWRKFHFRACAELDSDEITKSCDSKPESDAMRLYQAVDRLATQAGEDAGETIDWLCGEHKGMFKLFESYFSPKPIANPLANQTVASGSPIDSSTNIAVSSIDSSDSATRSADSSETFGKTEGQA